MGKCGDEVPAGLPPDQGIDKQIQFDAIPIYLINLNLISQKMCQQGHT
jgi:hypothetical protein